MIENLHNNKDLRENCFNVPDGYFDNMESNLRSFVFKENSASYGPTRVLKTAFFLTLAFIFIISMGYGVAQLTNNISGDFSQEYLFSDYTYCPPQIEFLEEDILDRYSNPNLSIEELNEYFSEEEYIPFSLYKIISSTEK